MNTLWASLLGLILIALAVVLAFNFLQGRQTRLRDAWREKLARRGERAAEVPRNPGRGEATPPREPASGTGVPARVEPTLGGSGDGATPAPPSGDSTADPVWTTTPLAVRPETPAAPTWRSAGDGPDADDPADGPLRTARAVQDERDEGEEGGEGADTRRTAPVPQRVAAATGAVLDPRLDCIVELTLAAPIAPERLLAAVSTLRRAGSKPVAIEADAGDGRWAVPHAAGGPCRRVRAGVLLANRNGPLNAMEFSEFGTAAQALGRSLGAGGAVVPEMAPVLEHARQLDDACAQLDAVIGLNIETPSALSPAELAALAFGLGLSERGNNRFAQLGDDGEVLYSLALGERAEQLTLLLDVPRAPQQAEPWLQMVDSAKQCAERTGGRLVDDAGQPLTESAVTVVSRQLAQRYRSLQEAGLDAGSTAALRVFN